MHTRTGRLLALVTALATLFFALGVPTASAAPPGSGYGTVRVTFSTPEGVPGVATLTGKSGLYAATKPSISTSVTVDVAVPSGQYSIQALPVIVDGKR